MSVGPAETAAGEGLGDGSGTMAVVGVQAPRRMSAVSTTAGDARSLNTS